MSTIREQLISSIYGQESSYGKADTSKENYAGARGPMQVTKKTFAGLQQKGLIPREWDHANPEHTMKAGITLINHLSDKYQDDPAKVAAAYYAGEKAVRADGSIANFRDLKNPKAPDTHKYVKEVLGRMGNSPQAVPTERIPASLEASIPPERISAQESWTIGMPDINRYGKDRDNGAGSKPVPQALPADTDKIVADPAALPALIKADEVAAVKYAQEVKDSSMLDKSRASFMTTLFGAAARQIARPEFEADQAFVLDPKELAGRTSDEQEALRQVESQAELDRIKWELEDRRDQQREAGLGGVASAMLAGTIAALPEGIVTGSVAMRAMQIARVGSLAYAAQGNKVGAWVSAAAENVGGNLGALAIQDQLDGFVSKEDYAMNAALGLVVTPLTASGAFKEADRMYQKKAAAAMVQQAAERINNTRVQAIKNLGPDATPAQLQAEMQRLETAEVRETITGAVAPLGGDRRLLPPMEELDEAAAGPKIDEPTAPTQDRATSEAVGQASPDATNAPGKNDPVLNTALIDDASLESLITRDNVDANMNKLLARPDTLVRWKTGEAPESVRAHVKRMYGRDIDQVKNSAPGVYADADLPPAMVEAVKWLQKTFMKDTKVMLVNGDVYKAGMDLSTKGDHTYFGDSISFIRVRPIFPDAMLTVIHEVGHGVIATQFKKLGQQYQDAFKQLHKDWLANYKGAVEPMDAAMQRGTSISQYTRDVDRPAAKKFKASMFDVMAGVINKNTGKLQRAAPDLLESAKTYLPNADEFSAEQFTKYVEAALADVLGWKPKEVPKGVVEFFKNAWNKFASFFNRAKERGLLAPDARAVDVFDEIRRINEGAVKRGEEAVSGEGLPKTSEARATNAGPQRPDLSTDPTAVKYGLDLLPVDTPGRAAEAKAILQLYKHAEVWAAKNPIDEKRLESLTDTFGFGSTSLIMLKSKNPVVRMIAAELLENGSGAAGRRSTAALSKFLAERTFMGNTINDVQAAYRPWRAARGGSVFNDVFDGKQWQAYNRLVAEELEARKGGVKPVGTDPAVAKAADVLEAAYERMRLAQIDQKTVGWAALPETSVGYMPHKMSPEKVANLTLEQTRVLHSALTDQFIQIEGFDITFSDQLASKYIDRVKARALGGYDATINLHQTGAADVVEDALKAMGLTQDEVRTMMGRYMKGGAGHTKRRLQLDLNQVHQTSTGEFRLLDLFETDQLKLVRSQAQRVSGEVALARYGVMGKSGLALLRRSMGYGDTDTRAQARELEAFDQVAAEFLGEPFGTQAGKWADRAMLANSLARLGGMGFTQFAEFINGVAHVGAGKTLAAISGMGRLRAEAKALARGEAVDNPVLGSIEKFGGAEFGTDAYKMVFPFDNGSLEFQTYGKDTVTFADRALRGGSMIQGKLSFWRAIHSAQQRGMAEQIVHKAAGYLLRGGDDVALRDMGIDDDLRTRLQADLPAIAKFDGDRLVEFDITKAKDQEAALAFVQAVHRGTSQIIQGTYIGETGKWAHSGILRLMTQFRTFSITSIEKQWARQQGNYGTAKALGMLLGAMSMAAPIYMARTAASAVGREDKEEYLERQLSATQIARASLNYVAMSGLAGDFLDAFTAVSGTGELTGGRSGAASGFVGNLVAPSLGWVDDVWRGIQNNKEGTDVHELLKAMPFSKLPGITQAINGLD